MPNWKALLDELNSAGNQFDIIRRKYLAELHEYLDRNIIIYYSGWLQKKDLMRKGVTGFDLNDEDKLGFMSAIHELDRSKGLDLILHTPGGELAFTESLVGYLREMFGTNIRAIIPQLAMSAGTMMACSCKEIILGKHSSLGPIDPHFNGIPTHGIIEEFNRAFNEIKKNGAAIPLWQPIIAKYSPTLIGECEKAIEWTKEMVKEWLITGMFKDDTNATEKADAIIEELGSHALTKSHNRHISLKKALDIGLKVRALEDDDKLQDKILTVHHACVLTLDSTSAIKIIENHKGIAYVKHVNAAVPLINTSNI